MIILAFMPSSKSPCISAHEEGKSASYLQEKCKVTLILLQIRYYCCVVQGISDTLLTNGYFLLYMQVLWAYFSNKQSLYYITSCAIRMEMCLKMP